MTACLPAPLNASANGCPPNPADRLAPTIEIRSRGSAGASGMVDDGGGGADELRVHAASTSSATGHCFTLVRSCRFKVRARLPRMRAVLVCLLLLGAVACSDKGDDGGKPPQG